MNTREFTQKIATSLVLILVFVTLSIGQEQRSGQPEPSATSGDRSQGSLSKTESMGANAGTEIITWIEKHSGAITLVVTVVGFGLVCFQIFQAKKSLNGSTYAAVYNQQHAINQLFVDNPEFRGYFYNNVECPPSDSNRSRLLPVTDMFADFFEHLWVQERNLPRHIWPA